MRLFVAIELSGSWRDAAAAVRAQLESRLDPEARSSLRWVQPELLHLTLRFLGEFPDDAVGALQLAIDREVPSVDLALTTAGAGAYGGRRARVVWLGVDGDLGGLQALASAVERACVAAGAKPEARPFSPHITLARVRERASLDARGAVAAAVGGLAPPTREEMLVRGVALVRSTLGAGPPRYEVLSRHPRTS